MGIVFEPNKAKVYEQNRIIVKDTGKRYNMTILIDEEELRRMVGKAMFNKNLKARLGCATVLLEEVREG